MATEPSHPVYTPLDTARRQFRLIRLRLPDCEDDVLSFELKIFDLNNRAADNTDGGSNIAISGSSQFDQRSGYGSIADEITSLSPQCATASTRSEDTIHLESAPFEYRALSYMWGTTIAEHEILLNGMPFMVRQNLYSFLLSIKSQRDFDWVFVDAICIDQSNLDERAAQVKLMGEIFPGAATVIAWLNPSELGSHEKIFEPFRQMLSGWHDMPDRHSNSDNSKSLEEFARSELFANAIPFLLSLFSLPFWTRTWVTQELLLARNLKLRCGEDTIEWTDISIVIKVMVGVLSLKFGTLTERSRYTPLIPETNNTIAYLQAYRLVRYRQDYTEREKKMGLLAALSAFSHHKCSQINDKVFGLLSLTKSRMPVDYRMDVVELYVRAFAEAFGDLMRSPAYREMTFDEGITSLIFCLPRALQLKRYDPVVMLLTYQVLVTWCSTRAKGSSQAEVSKTASRALPILLYQAEMYEVARDTIGIPTDPKWKGLVLAIRLTHLWHKVRYGLCWAWISWHRWRNAPLTVDGHTGSRKTYEEWNGLVAEIMAEITPPSHPGKTG